MTPLPLKPSAAADHHHPDESSAKKRGRKPAGPKKPPQRGMGVAQLERLRQLEPWATFPSAAANPPVLLSPPPPLFPETLSGISTHYPNQPPQLLPYGPDVVSQSLTGHRIGRFGVGPTAGSHCSLQYCTVCLKKKRSPEYGIREAPPVATGYGHVGPTYNYPNPNFEIGTQEEILAMMEKSAGVGKNRINVLTEYEFFPEKIGDRDRDRQVIGKLSGAVSGNSNIDLSLRL